MANQFDLVVIGGGPGGYVAAIRAAQLGLKTGIVDKRSSLGGTCLNIGCIPSKALLDSSEHYYQAKHKLSEHGIEIGAIKLNFAKMMERKNDVIKQSIQGIDFLMTKNNITRFEGVASFKDSTHITITKDKDTKTVHSKHFIIATGSEPIGLPFAPFDGKRIISSTEALELKSVPQHMIIVGAGVIGLEIGSVYARLGTTITVIEFMDTITPSMDRELSQALQKILEKSNFHFHLKSKVSAIKVVKDSVQISASLHSGEMMQFQGDYALVAIGRRPYTQDLNLDAAGVKTDKGGRIQTNSHLQTDCETIYAIGDVIAGAMLAHKAEEEGMVAAEIIAGQKSEINYNTIPGVIYTWPEVACVGQTEEQLKAATIKYNTGKFYFRASGRARAAGDFDGFVKMLADAKTDEILGVHMIGPRCSDLIAEAVVAMEYKASAEDIGRISHAHPTFSEPIKEAALMATANRAIHC